jgi:hypothetical protein
LSEASSLQFFYITSWGSRDDDDDDDDDDLN